MIPTSPKCMKWHKIMIIPYQIEKFCSFVKLVFQPDACLDNLSTQFCERGALERKFATTRNHQVMSQIP